MNTVISGWEKFEKLILEPINASDIQRLEMKKAFFAGAAEAMSILMVVSNKQTSEEAGAAIIEGIVQEIESFANDVLQSNIPVQPFYWKE